ncbi:LytR family transcriptional regulator [Paenibacillus sp. 79R4]|nr:LytR family transcriptional regulator [Paenibacillus sp. 79R4]
MTVSNTSESKTKSKSTSKSKSKINRKALKIAGMALTALILGVCIYVGYIYYKAETTIHRIASPENLTEKYQSSAPGSDHNAEQQVPAPQLKPMIFMLAGVDSRDGSGGTVNTDVLMIVSYNPDTRSAKLLSLPRDLMVKSEFARSRKANYYYAYYYIKDKTAAISNTKQFYSNLLDLPIDYMVVMDFDALRKTVDALGGLQIDVEMDMKYRDTADGTNIDLRKGLQKLDGSQVLDYVRYRKSNQGTQESSDFARNERQQKVIKQILEKLGAFQGISQWGTILDIIGDHVTSDFPESLIRQGILNFSSLKPNQIQTLKMDSIWKSPFVYVKQEDLQKALIELREEVGLSADSQPRFKSIGTMD